MFELTEDERKVLQSLDGKFASTTMSHESWYTESDCTIRVSNSTKDIRSALTNTLNTHGVAEVSIMGHVPAWTALKDVSRVSEEGPFKNRLKITMRHMSSLAKLRYAFNPPIPGFVVRDSVEQAAFILSRREEWLIVRFDDGTVALVPSEAFRIRAFIVVIRLEVNDPVFTVKPNCEDRPAGA